MLGKKLINAGPVSSGANTFASENFNTVLYTGNGSTQRIGGYINRGAEFNGSSSYISLANADSILGNPAGQSISVWANFNSVTTSGFNSTVLLASNNGVGAADWQITLYDGKIYADYFDAAGAYRQRIGSTVLSANTWYHFVIVFDSTNSDIIQCYVNGSAETMTNQTSGGTFSGNIDNSSIPITIGRRDLAGGSWYMNGKIDQIRIFNKALSSSEVTTLYGETHASTTISTTDIFSDNSGVALYQLDGNANDTGGVSGKFGAGGIFNGSSSKIATSLNNSDIESFSFWFYFESGTTIGRALGSNVSSSGGDLSVEVATNGTIVCQLQNLQYATSTGALGSTGWKHIYYDTNRDLYINGTLNSSGTDSTTSFPSSTALIGALRTNYGFINTKIDDLRFYSDVLTSTEVGYIYNNTTASIPTDNLLAYYKLDGDARDEQQLYDGVATNVTYAYDGTATNVTYQEATKFQPDLVWIKNRSSVYSHCLVDSVRGVSSTLFTDGTYTQDTTSGLYLSSFDSNGFTVGTGNAVSANSNNIVAWCFKGGGADVLNENGSINSQVSANTDAGFSIVSYAGNNGSSATIGHGLNSAPELVIIKARNLAAGWPTLAAPNGTIVYTRRLNDTGATDSSLGSVFFNSTAPTSSVFTVGGSDEVNDGYNYIAYCFHSVDGYSKIGSYTGTGTTNGNFVETGFEPAFVMVKRTDGGAQNWVMFDNKRSTTNPRTKKLAANLSSDENNSGTIGTDAQDNLDFYADGFRPVTSNNHTNISGGTFIYLAIAADPDTTTPTVENSFDVVTYTGTGAAQDIDTDFKPDLVWIKGRSDAEGARLFDSIRGANQALFSNATGAESTVSNELTAINEDGFTLGSSENVNQSSQTYVAWCWKAGDHDDNLPQINTEGSIDSVVSVNAEAGFSIVKYTTPTTNNFSVGHGLSSAPELVFFKGLNQADNWITYASTTGATKYLRLNGTDAATTSSLPFNDTSPTSTVINLGSASTFWGTSIDTIAYCFHSVSGYQKIGSYSGTGSAGNAQNVGFAPRFVMVKSYSGSTSNWAIFDTNRDGLKLNANDNSAETSDTRVTLTSTGFQFTGGAYNNSGVDWIYLAIK